MIRASWEEGGTSSFELELNLSCSFKRIRLVHYSSIYIYIYIFVFPPSESVVDVIHSAKLITELHRGLENSSSTRL